MQARETVADRVRMHQAAGDDPEAERTTRQALQTRHDAIVGEQQRRRARQIADRPPVADLDDDALSEEYNDLLKRDFRKAPLEAQRVLEGRLEDIKRERRDRKKRAITDRDAPENMDAGALAEEYTELRRARSSYDETDDVKAARKERMAALEAEQNRRDTTPEVEQLLARIDNPDDNGAISIDGRSGYGYIDYNVNPGWGSDRREVGWTWGKNSYAHGNTAYPRVPPPWQRWSGRTTTTPRPAVSAPGAISAVSSCRRCSWSCTRAGAWVTGLPAPRRNGSTSTTCSRTGTAGTTV